MQELPIFDALGIAIPGLVVLIGLAVFFWRRNGAGSGRGLGNAVAAHLGLPRKVFYQLLDHGAADGSRDVLARLQHQQAGLDQASAELAPVLAKGITRIEARFGRQDMVDQAKPIVARWLPPGEAGP